MVFNATFNNISAISWRSVSLMEEIFIFELTKEYWRRGTRGQHPFISFVSIEYIEFTIKCQLYKYI
jgi:hypothetical protein